MGEAEASTAEFHHALLWDRHVAYGERAELQNGKFTPYMKEPGMLSLCVAGELPAVRFSSEPEAIVCVFAEEWAKGVWSELEAKSANSPREQVGIHDLALHSLLSLLASECAAGGPNGSLYAESLSHAAAVRFLHLTDGISGMESDAGSPLPRHLVARIVEYMRTNFHLNTDLATLASESGYSRAHFLRMFRLATGKTPHQYLMDIRLHEAKKRLSNPALPLSTIAVVCGFSSQSHFSQLFTRAFGFTPGEYRRKI